MGNSGSMHNLAAIDAHNQYNHNAQHQQMPPQQWAQSFPRPSHPQFKVLPDSVPGSKVLRTTNNGAILQSGGTLTNRKDLPNGVQRSKSISAPQYPVHPNMNALRERSRTQLNMIEEREARISNYKRFGSEPDLRGSGDEENVANTKGKAKLMRNKKKKAAPPPPLATKHGMENEYDPARFGWRSNKNQYSSHVPPQRPQEPPPRKLRLFKTKAESKKPNVESKTTRSSDQSEQQWRTLDRKESAAETFRVIEQIPPRETNHIRSRTQPSMAPQFRREKSFDASLLSSKKNDMENYLRGRRQRAASPTTERVSAQPVKQQQQQQRYPSEQESQQIIKPIKNINEPPKNLRKVKEDSKDKLRKVSQPSHSSSGNSFQQELLEATKRRSIVAEVKEVIEEPKEIIMKKTTTTRVTSKITSTTNSKPKENIREPPAKKTIPEIVPAKTKEMVVEGITSRKPSTNAPLPAKTFYFGMGDKVEHEITKDGGMDKTQMDVIDKFAESIMKRKAIPKLNESSESALSSDVDDGINENNSHEEIIPIEGEAEGISLQLRPTLPKKLFEIPRFSPSAAWRLLSPDDDQKESAKWYHPEKLNLEPYSTRQFEVECTGSEDRIERIYRDPIPGLPDNKSGDSGISGDAGLAERDDNLVKNDNELINKKPTIGPFLSAWTPQQDLGEESSSDDAELVTKNEGTKYNGTRGHVFSLSLPREVHIASQLSEKSEKQSFTTNSLQKLKKTVSGAFSGSSIHEKNDNFRSDNWLLSRSQPNSIDNNPMSPPTEKDDNVQTKRKPEDRQISSHQSRMSATIAPPSFSYLAGGKHMMYLPNHPIGETSDFNLISTGRREFLDNLVAKDDFTDLNIEEEAKRNRESLQDPPSIKMEYPAKLLSKSKNHRFTFQSTVRQIERRKIADKLSKEAEEKEAQRLSELEAMRRVEEEFQKKRAREKASIRQQLRLFSMEENQCTSLPVEWSSNARADPDGAVSSPKHSPVTQKSKIFVDDNLELVKQDSCNDSYVDTKTPYISKLIEQKSSKINRTVDSAQSKYPNTPATEILSEFHQSRREYLEYRGGGGGGYGNKRSDSPVISSSSRNSNNNGRNQSTEHPTVVCNIPAARNLKSYDYDYNEHELPIQADNYRKDFARGINSSDSEISGPSLNGSNRIRVKQISRF